MAIRHTAQQRSTSSVIREIQIQATVKYISHLNMALIQRTDKDNFGEGVETLELSHFHWWECKTVGPLWKNSVAVP